MNIGLNITQPNNIVLILGDASPFEWEMKHQAKLKVLQCWEQSLGRSVKNCGWQLQ